LVHHRVPIPPREFVAIAADLPDDSPPETVDVSQLPSDWQADPPPRALPRLGSEWARSLGSLVLIVPSALVPQEFNYLINPRHPAAARLSLHPPRAFPFDPRFWTG
jgi:RES domain-containing protein